MPDPFESLRTPLTPVDPDPTFTASLRDRVARALGLATTLGTSMTVQTTQRESLTVTVTPTLVPYLMVADARRALDWYVAVFGARRRIEAVVMPDGRIGHAELELNGALLYLADEFPENQLIAPPPGGAVSVSLTVMVTDVDLMAERATGAGAALERPPADHPYGRDAVVRDPFGHRWMLSSRPEPAASGGPRQGDISYVSLWVLDAGRASTFLGDVLGWTYAPPTGEVRQVTNTSLHHGIAPAAEAVRYFAERLGEGGRRWFGGQARTTLFVCLVVDDVDAAVERVRAAGGHADQPTDESYGRIANCVDDQGMPFALYTDSVGSSRPRDAATGSRPGDLAYVVFEVRDADRARTFFEHVVGWRYTPGRSEDGWNVEDIVPMSGISGGHANARVVPMYRVDNIEAAVARARAAGGTSTDPHRELYGITAECADEQGTRFYLGQGQL